MKKLVAYFSATGTTKNLAKNLAKAIEADLFEIEPAKPYTKSDLDWTNKQSRSSLEMKDLGSRPQIANRLDNIDEYNIIFIGFPIWWYVAPTIINTFLESYDLTGKIVVPFATSGGSGMGNTNKNLIASCNGAILKEGRRFSMNTGQEELKNWAEKF